MEAEVTFFIYFCMSLNTLMNMDDYSKLTEQLNRIEEQQDKILEFLQEFKSVTFTNFEYIANRLDKDTPIPGISNSN